MYIGAFDSTYEGSVSATGNLYVCGNTGGLPTLYQIPITDGTMGEVNVGPALATGTGAIPCSPVTDVPNPNAAGGATEWLFASVQTGGVPTNCASGGCVMNLKDTPWLPSTAYSVGQEVLDTGLHIEVVKTAGLSGPGHPTWAGGTGSPTVDRTVTWLDQGPATVSIPAAWAATHSYTKGTEILDSNNNIELDTTSGIHTSGSTVPAFSTTPGGTAPPDGAIVWENLGAIATANMPAAGGTSGIIIDNFVNALTEPGASQIYFSTLSNQTCATSATNGGCAVQASQSALQ
jgi:hypothetical protein